MMISISMCYAMCCWFFFLFYFSFTSIIFEQSIVCAVHCPLRARPPAQAVPARPAETGPWAREEIQRKACRYYCPAPYPPQGEAQHEGPPEAEEAHEVRITVLWILYNEDKICSCISEILRNEDAHSLMKSVLILFNCYLVWCMTLHVDVTKISIIFNHICFKDARYHEEFFLCKALLCCGSQFFVAN